MFRTMRVRRGMSTRRSSLPGCPSQRLEQRCRRRRHKDVLKQVELIVGLSGSLSCGNGRVSRRQRDEVFRREWCVGARETCRQEVRVSTYLALSWDESGCHRVAYYDSDDGYWVGK